MSKSTKNTPIKPAEDVKDVTAMEPTEVIKELNERLKSSNQLAAALNEEIVGRDFQRSGRVLFRDRHIDYADVAD